MAKLLVITGASCSGKTFVEKQIMNELDVCHLQTTTTRKPREVDDYQYYRYIDKELFHKELLENKYAEHNVYANNLYGISKETVDQIPLSRTNRWSVVLDFNGACNISRYCMIHKLPIELGCFVLAVPSQIAVNRLLNRVLDDYKNNKCDTETAVGTIKNRYAEIVGFDHFRCYELLNESNENGIINYNTINLLDNSFESSIENIVYLASKFFGE